jgi:hypothetical protein
MEHQIKCPDRERVIDFLDITTLFIEATNRFLYAFPGDSEVENNSIRNFWLDVNVNHENRALKITIIQSDKPNEKVEIKVDDSGYAELMKAYLSLFKNI